MSCHRGGSPRDQAESGHTGALPSARARRRLKALDASKRRYVLVQLLLAHPAQKVELQRLERPLRPLGVLAVVVEAGKESSDAPQATEALEDPDIRPAPRYRYACRARHVLIVYASKAKRTAESQEKSAANGVPNSCDYVPPKPRSPRSLGNRVLETPLERPQESASQAGARPHRMAAAEGSRLGQRLDLAPGDTILDLPPPPPRPDRPPTLARHRPGSPT